MVAPDQDGGEGEAPSPAGGGPRPASRGIEERLARLVAAKARFLRFLERRVEDPVVAEDLLQTALLRLVERDAGPRDDERLVPWFFQVLRNLVADHHRRRAAGDRARAALSAESPATTAPDDDLFRAVCTCVGDLATTLRPAYAEVLRRVDIEDQALPEVARGLALTRNALAVRLHRARRALRDAVLVTCRACATHGCLDCTCRPGRPVAPP